VATAGGAAAKTAIHAAFVNYKEIAKEQGLFDVTSILTAKRGKFGQQIFDEFTFLADSVNKLTYEITLVISGRQLCNGEIFSAGEICVLEPGDISQIEYLEETEVVTIKTPSIPSDKYLL
jgi:hypothetical protein